MGNNESSLKGMCCNNAFCNAEADIENYEAKQNQPKTGEQPTNQVPGNVNLQQQRERNGAMAGSSMYSGGYSYERGQTKLMSDGGDLSNFQAATSNFGHYEEPQVDVLANSRKVQLAQALGHGQQQYQGPTGFMHDRNDSGAITADNLLARQDDRWMEYRDKLERALPDAPILELTI